LWDALTAPGNHPLELVDTGVTAMLDEPDGRVIAYFVVLRLRHRETGDEFDIMLRAEHDVFHAMLTRLREFPPY